VLATKRAILTQNTKSDKRWFISVRESRRTWLILLATSGVARMQPRSDRPMEDSTHCKRLSAFLNRGSLTTERWARSVGSASASSPVFLLPFHFAAAVVLVRLLEVRPRDEREPVSDPGFAAAAAILLLLTLSGCAADPPCLLAAAAHRLDGQRRRSVCGGLVVDPPPALRKALLFSVGCYRHHVPPKLG
jgi:hypothetical protein